jgi:acyl-CoA synthetase (AMP-forming)/AMP-acid ligase II
MQLSSLLAHHARYRPHATAVVFEEQRLDYSEFSARIDRVAHALLGLGIGKGERVASLLPNCLELLDLYWACARIGAVAVPLSPLLTGTGLASLIADADARCLLTRREFLPVVEAVLHATADAGAGARAADRWCSSALGRLRRARRRRARRPAAGCRRRPRRPVQHHVHLGHHGAAQGHHAQPPHPRQLRAATRGRPGA